MSKIYLYFHGGSENHGCEAIVRSTVKILGDNLYLATSNIESDRKYHLDQIVTLIDDSPCALNKVQSLIAAVYFKLTHNDYYFTYFRHKKFFDVVGKNDICLSIGGDNYCYKGQDILAHYNKALHKKGAKTVLWGCSVEPNVIKGDIAKDLSTYDLIVARESYSYEALKAVNNNTVLACDPAFQLDQEQLGLPENFINKNTVGINVSPLIMESESSENITMENYINLIRFIIENTDMNVALIPHVTINGNDDRTSLKALYERFKDTNRMCLFDDMNCEQIKGYISRCRFLITARTHASIAAYSTCVPTLVAGYSIKAKGIALDLFGTYKNLVVPVQSMKTSNDLVESFKWIVKNEKDIVNKMESIMDDKKSTILTTKEMIENL